MPTTMGDIEVEYFHLYRKFCWTLLRYIAGGYVNHLIIELLKLLTTGDYNSSLLVLAKGKQRWPTLDIFLLESFRDLLARGGFVTLNSIVLVLWKPLNSHTFLINHGYSNYPYFNLGLQVPKSPCFLSCSLLNLLCDGKEYQEEDIPIEYNFEKRNQIIGKDREYGALNGRDYSWPLSLQNGREKK